MSIHPFLKAHRTCVLMDSIQQSRQLIFVNDLAAKLTPHCLRIAHRPTTSTLCALALFFTLLGFISGYVLQLIRLLGFGTWPMLGLLSGALMVVFWLLGIVCLLAVAVLVVRLKGRVDQVGSSIDTLGVRLDEQAKRGDALSGQLREQARDTDAVVRRLGAGLDVSAEADRAPVGGGSLPGFELDTWTVALRGEPGAVLLAERLRRASRPVLSRVRDGACVLDCRTLSDEDCPVLAASLESALR